MDLSKVCDTTGNKGHKSITILAQKKAECTF